MNRVNRNKLDGKKLKPLPGGLPAMPLVSSDVSHRKQGIFCPKLKPTGSIPVRAPNTIFFRDVTQCARMAYRGGGVRLVGI